MFEKFSHAAIRVITLAREESQRTGHNFLGTEHIMLGLIGEDVGIAAKVLKASGVNLKDARTEVQKIIGIGSGFVAVEVPLTPRSKRVLDLAQKESLKLGHEDVGTEHLLLALVREGEGVAMRVLKNFGLEATKIHGDVLRLLAEQLSQEYSQGSGLNPKLVSSSRTCPSCAETIKAEAHVCFFCGYGLSDEHFVECRFCKERIRKEAVRCKYCHAALGDPVE